MRLIDANELHPTYNRGFYVAGVMVGGSYTLDYEEIENAPTVDAIPVEWIREWANKYCDSCQENLIKCLLRTWGKENEVNISQ